MPYALTRRLKRETTIQEVKVPADAKPVKLMNRGGDPSVYFITGMPQPVAGQAVTTRTVKLVLTSGEGLAPDKAEYIDTAEFSGGQLLYHVWMLPDGQ